MTEPLLQVTDLHRRFGGVIAVAECSFDVADRSITGLIGPNGSGKTTLLNMVSGYLLPDSGTIRFGGREVTRSNPTRMYRHGLSRTFQRARILPELDVVANLLVAIPQRGLNLLRPGHDRASIDRAMHLLEEFRLIRYAELRAGELSYGQQKLLEFASVLMAQPRMVLLDEPTAGVNHVMIDLMVERIEEFHGQGITFLIVEHNMEFVMSICEAIVVMDRGRVLSEGTPAAIQSDRSVIDAYLGD
jgi:ABC-type branched-subunit amino acid transport system ATPase component